MSKRKKFKGFDNNKKQKQPKNKKHIHDGLFLFAINHEKPSIGIEFTDNVSNRIAELEEDGYLVLLGNPGCSALLSKLYKRVNVLAEKNINEDTDPDLIPEIYLQAFEYISWKMISEEIYFPIAESAEYRLRHKSVVQDRHPENKLINTL